MGKGVNPIGLGLTAVAGYITGKTIANKIEEKNNQKGNKPKTSIELIDELKKDAGFLQGNKYSKMLDEFAIVAIKLEKKFPNIHIVQDLLDDFKQLRIAGGNTKYGSRNMIEERRRFVKEIISNMEKLISQNKQDLAVLKKEVINFKNKIETVTPDNRIHNVRKKQILERVINHIKGRKEFPRKKFYFYSKGNKVKYNIPLNIDINFGNFGKDADKIAKELNEIYHKVFEYKKKAGPNPHIGMLIDIIQNPEKAKMYKLELKGTILGKELLNS